MLDKHLVVKTFGRADDCNIVLWSDYRVTVLGERLFRVENNGKRVWRDGATQSVWYRNAEKQSFTVTQSEKECVIKTPEASLILKKELSACLVELDGKKLPLGNGGNLLGTYRTLDNCDGGEYVVYSGITPISRTDVRLGFGVCSTDGVAVIDDASSLTLGDDGKIKPERGEGCDLYVFAYGHDYRGAVRALYGITGDTPLLPRYALGNWWSRYYVYTDKSYLTLLDKFFEREIPLTVATIDMDWHYSNNLDDEFGITEKGRDGEFYGGTSGWTGYSWNKKLFPDYKLFLNRIRERNLNITLNLHPADGIRWFEDCYPQMAAAMGVDRESGQKIPFDVTDDDFINNYFSVVHKPYEKDGVRFWWIDWQQGTHSRMDGLDPLWSLNHYHYLDIAKDDSDPLILSRYSGVGSHRYPVGFSGDTHMTWQTLKYLPYFTATASNIGYTWWSHDIGGHMFGSTNGELYLRFVQYGVFSPINRLHCCNSRFVTKEPRFYGNGTGELAEQFLKFRHRMIPFLYTADYNTHANGRALVEPIYYDYPDNKNAYEYGDREYLFGGLLVAPVTNPNESDGYARVDAWLPQGKYTDIFTGDEYTVKEKDGRRSTLLRRLDSLPVLAKAGTILPLSLDKGNGVDNPHRLEIKVYSGDGEYTLYEDKNSGRGGAYFTKFNVKKKDGEVRLQIRGEGDKAVIPSGRKLRVVFANIRNGKAELYVNGKAVQTSDEYFDDLTVTVDFVADNTYEIVAHDLNSEFDNLLERVMDILTESEEELVTKDACRDGLNKAKTVKDILKVIDSSALSDANKQRVKEIL